MVDAASLRVDPGGVRSHLPGSAREARLNRSSGATMGTQCSFLRSRKLRLLAVCLLLAAAGGGWWLTRCPLDEFVDRDLRMLDPDPLPDWKKQLAKWIPLEVVSGQARLNKVLERILPEEFIQEHRFGLAFFGAQPWHLWRCKSDAGASFILLVCRPVRMIPGSAKVYLHFFDSNARHLGCTDFHVGGRTDLESASYRYEPLVATLILELQTQATLHGYDGRQFYVLRDQRVALMRWENREGKLWRTRYDEKWASVGCLPPNRSANEWEDLLMSDNACDILEALTWIGGDHRTSNWNQKTKKYDSTELAVSVRALTRVQNRIAALAKSENVWHKEAAILAQEHLND